MKKILIADDSLFMRSLLKRNLSKLPSPVFKEASNGRQAIQMYQRFNPDVVILDITMPELNGIDALKEIIAFDPNAKVIMCSALGQQKIIIEAIKSGAKDFVIKPNFNNLESIVSKALDN